MALLLRDALLSELATIDALCVEAYLEYAPIVGPEAWDQMAANLACASRFAGTARFVVAVEADAVLGFVMYFPPGAADESLFPRDWASFRFLAVASGVERELDKRPLYSFEDGFRRCSRW